MKLQFPINFERINEERISISHCWTTQDTCSQKRVQVHPVLAHTAVSKALQ